MAEKLKASSSAPPPFDSQNCIDPPPSYSESQNIEDQSGTSQTAPVTVNLLHQPAVQNLQQEKCIHVKIDGSSYGEYKYSMGFKNSAYLLEATVYYRRCNQNNTYHYKALFDGGEDMTITPAPPQTYNNSYERVLDLVNESNVKMAQIGKLKVADSDGNVLKIFNEEKQEIFRLRMIVTQAMLGENTDHRSAKEVAYEVFTATGDNIGKIVYQRGTNGVVKNNYRFLYTLPLDNPTLTVILSSIFGLENDRMNHSNLSFQKGICLSFFVIFTIIISGVIGSL